jgi:predicted Zn-dependent peptidase
VIDLVRDEVDSLVTHGITEAELERAKGHLKGSLVLSAEDPSSRMNRLGKQQLTTGEIISIDELIERFDRIEMDDMTSIINRILSQKDFMVTVVGPFDKGAFDRYAA